MQPYRAQKINHQRWKVCGRKASVSNSSFFMCHCSVLAPRSFVMKRIIQAVLRSDTATTVSVRLQRQTKLPVIDCKHAREHCLTPLTQNTAFTGAVLSTWWNVHVQISGSSRTGEIYFLPARFLLSDEEMMKTGAVRLKEGSLKMYYLCSQQNARAPTMSDLSAHHRPNLKGEKSQFFTLLHILLYLTLSLCFCRKKMGCSSQI